MCVEGGVLWAGCVQTPNLEVVNGQNDLKAWLGVHDGSAALQFYAGDDNMIIVDPAGVSTMRDDAYDE